MVYNVKSRECEPFQKASFFLLREPLKPSAADDRSAADSITPAQLRSLRAIAQDMCTAFEEGNLKRCSSLNKKFHLTLYRTTGNEVLVECISDLWNKWPVGYFAYQIPDEWYRVSLQQHFDLLDAIEAKDRDLAQSIMLEHKSGSLDNFGKRPEVRGFLE